MMLIRQPSALQRALVRAHDPEVISLALGLPAPELFPCVELGEAADVILRDGPSALQYSRPEQCLKEHIVRLMTYRGVLCAQDEVVLTTGAQQGLALLSQLLLSASRNTVMVDQAVYPGFRQAVEPWDVHLMSVPRDASEGMNLKAASDALKDRSRPAFLYAISVGHNPLGVTLTASKRQALVEFAAHHGIPIVEDDVYGFLQYDSTVAVPLRSLNWDGAFYIGSFSKILAPALRIGWIIAPKKWTTSISVLKEGYDTNISTFSQRIVCRYLDSHSLPQHIEFLRSQYRLRRDAMHDALRRYFPSGTHWTKPQAGFFFWVENDTFDDTAAILNLALEKHVSYVPGEAFCVPPERFHNHAMRLNFSYCASDLIDDGIARLADAVNEYRELFGPWRQKWSVGDGVH